MKVMLINGSPHAQGTTYAALREVEKELNAEGIETEIFHVGLQPVRGCMGCAQCRAGGKRRCVFDDCVNEALDRAERADGFIFGTPVHYAGPSGMMASFLDRFFFAGGGMFAYRPGACVVCCRRGGASSAFDQMNKYFTISNMPVVSSRYWNMVYGRNPEEAAGDEEGMQTMRTLGKNMAWLLKCIEAGKRNGIEPPKG